MSNNFEGNFSNHMKLDELLPAITSTIHKAETTAAYIDTRKHLDVFFENSTNFTSRQAAQRAYMTTTTNNTFNASATYAPSTDITNTVRAKSTLFNIKNKIHTVDDFAIQSTQRQTIKECSVDLSLDVINSDGNSVGVAIHEGDTPSNTLKLMYTKRPPTDGFEKFLNILE